MAEFCKQCAVRVWGEGIPSDFVGMSTQENTDKGLYPVVLCEGCGPCQVDHEGKCVSVDCMHKHGAK